MYVRAEGVSIRESRVRCNSGLRLGLWKAARGLMCLLRLVNSRLGCEAPTHPAIWSLEEAPPQLPAPAWLPLGGQLHSPSTGHSYPCPFVDTQYIQHPQAITSRPGVLHIHNGPPYRNVHNPNVPKLAAVVITTCRMHLAIFLQKSTQLERHRPPPCNPLPYMLICLIISARWLPSDW
jgi:hypothetical protein